MAAIGFGLCRALPLGVSSARAPPARSPVRGRPRAACRRTARAAAPRPAPGARPPELRAYLRAASRSAPAADLAWAVRALAAHARDAPAGAGLPFGLWSAALSACLTRCGDLQAGMVVLHAGEALVPRNQRRRDAYVPVVRALAAAHRWDALVVLYERLWGDGVAGERREDGALRPDERLVVYGANLAVDAGRVHVAGELVAQMTDAGVRPSAYSYAVLLKGYGRARKIHAVERTLWEMRGAGVAFDQVTFNSAVDAFVRCGDMWAARRLVDDEENEPLRDTRTFNILIRGFARKGSVESAFAVRNEILDAGLRPNEVTQNSLVDACVRVGDFPSALKLADELAPGPGSVTASRPDSQNQLTIALSRILSGLAEKGKLDAAMKLLDEMGRRGAPPNHITYCALINACLRHRDVSRAHAIFRSMEAKTGVAPTLEIYNAMIAGLCKADDEFNVDSAVRMLRRMRESRPFARPLPVARTKGPGTVDSRAEVGAPARSGAAHATAARTSKSYRAPSVAPSDMTYNSVIDGLVRLNRVHDAEDVFEWMRDDGVTPSVITYTTLIKGWGAERNFAQAHRVFRTMSRDLVAPDTLALNAFIIASVRSDTPKMAHQVLKMMEDDCPDLDISPDVYSYTPLLAHYSRTGELHEVWDLYKRAREHDMVLNKYAADLMVNSIVSLGEKGAQSGRASEREKIANMAIQILDDAWEDVRDRGTARVWRKRLLRLFERNDDSELWQRVSLAGGGGALRSASEVIFEKHGWNDISSGWRPI